MRYRYRNQRVLRLGRLMEGIGKSLTRKSYEKPKYSLLACILCLLVTKAEAFCREKTYLSATEGRTVILHPVVAIAAEVLFILWIRDGATEIATIQYVEEKVFMQNNGNGDKVNISHNGSLAINNFTVEDQGTYTVMIKQLNQSDCNHTFYVSMSEKSPCGDIRDVAGGEEEEIILPIDADGVQVKIVYWLSPSGELLAKTKPGGYIQPQRNYERRVQTFTNNTSSLTIMKLSTEDQGIYVANVYMDSGKNCSQKYNVTVSGVIPETANMKTVYVISSEEREVTLPFPEHLKDQVEDVFWMKDYVKHIATTFMNGSLQVLDSGYQGRLYSTSNGSLIILDLRVEDRGKYSADIHLANNELYTEIYHLSIYKKSYHISLGIRYIHVTEGTDLCLQNDLQEIQSIDWLTPRWIRFAVTKLDGTMCIYNHNYSDRLSSLKDGSITIKSVTEKDEGIYRAHMFSPNGTLLELQYQAFIKKDKTLFHIVLGFAGVLALVLVFCSFLFIIIMHEKFRKIQHEKFRKIQHEKFRKIQIMKPIQELYEIKDVSLKRKRSSDQQSCSQLSDQKFRSPLSDAICHYSTEEVFKWPSRDSVGKTDWCSCKNCIPMATQEKSVCCRELKELDKFFDEKMTCILQKSELTGTKFDEQELIWLIEFSKRIPQDMFNEFRNRCLQKACNWSFIHFVHGRFDSRYHLPVPSCVLNYIRKRYPTLPQEIEEDYWSNEYDDLPMTPEKFNILHLSPLLHYHK